MPSYRHTLRGRYQDIYRYFVMIDLPTQGRLTKLELGELALHTGALLEPGTGGHAPANY